MEVGAITSHIDVAQVVLYAFWIFFAGLLFYLRKEDRREGYPLVSEVSGIQERSDPLWMPDPKTYRLSDGRRISVPNSIPDKRDFKAVQADGYTGAAFIPTGNPMLDAVGPANYAERSETPDLTYDGRNRIVPLRSDTHFWLEESDPDPRGMVVVGADGESVGKVVDGWIDRSELMLRYLELELDAKQAGSDNPRVLLPIHFMDVDARGRQIVVRAILSSQFAGVPRLASPDSVTLREEDRISAYYGSGYLYATPDRQEPRI
jgi:photosynthetic reaction center H subunit